MLAGPTRSDFSTRATLSEPAGIGSALTDLAAGAAAGWDERNMLEVYLPGQQLSSAPAESVLAGRNRIWIEQASGWELLAFRQADLMGQDHWRLSGLFRGINGSQTGSAPKGAVIVIADDRLVRPSVLPEEIGKPLIWRVGTSEDQTFTIRAMS